MNLNLKVSPLTPDFSFVSFKCGKNALDFHLKKYALFNQTRGFGKYWCLHEADSSEILGYYSINACSVGLENFPEHYSSDFPPHPVPCILIGRFAIDKRYQKNGYGGYLLHDCFCRIKKLSNSIGINAITVDALDLV